MRPDLKVPLLFGLSFIIISYVLCLQVAICDTSGDSLNEQVVRQNDVVAAKQVKGRVRYGFKIPDWFNFDKYKEAFHKQYSSLMDELVRRKIYLGRAIQVFVSNVRYKYYRSDSYLGVNPLSDRTANELFSLRLDKEHLRLSHYTGERNEILSEAKMQTDDDEQEDNEEKGVDLFEEAAELPLASPEDIQRELELIEKMKNEPGFHEIAMELDNSKESFETSEQPTDSLTVQRANNKLKGANLQDNQQPSRVQQLMDFSASIPGAIPKAFAGIVYNIPGANFVGNVVGDLASTLANKVGYGKEREPETEVYVDLRESGCLQPVKQQSTCGACYAFAGVALYEYVYCMATGKQVAFSEQYILDCGHRVKLEGCGGGTMDLTALFIEEYGLELETDKPYLARQTSCPYNSFVPSNYMGSIRVSKSGNMLIRLNEVDKYLSSKKFAGKPAGRPIMVGINSPKNFDGYAGGVDAGEGCSEEEGGHAMLLVGHGREDGKEYYMLRNSYSSRWGLKGYYKLNKEALHRCAADPVGLVTYANFNSSPESNSNPKNILKRRRVEEEKEQETSFNDDPFKRRRIVPFRRFDK